MGLSIVDMMTGLFAVFALLSGIIAARDTGVGRDIDVSLFDCALQNLNYLATWYLNEGHKQGREPRSSVFPDASCERPTTLPHPRSQMR